MKVLYWAVFFFFITPSYADFILSAPPRESLSDGIKVYTPLADYLSNVLNTKVSYRYPNNWMEYQRDMRKGKYDIVFDGPHFASWRIGNINHEAVAKLPGTLEFYLITKNANTKLKTIEDLVGKRFCAIAPPNLATMTILDRFANPLRIPILVETPGGFNGVLKSFQEDKCDAAVFRNTYYNKKIPAQQKKDFRIVYRSAPLPNQAITLNKKMGNHNIDKMVAALFSDEGKIHSQGIVNRFGGKNSKSFIKATSTEYAPYRQMLEQKLFGW